jgi:hypothetical protein
VLILKAEFFWRTTTAFVTGDVGFIASDFDEQATRSSQHRHIFMRDDRDVLLVNSQVAMSH